MLIMTILCISFAIKLELNFLVCLRLILFYRAILSLTIAHMCILHLECLYCFVVCYPLSLEPAMRIANDKDEGCVFGQLVTNDWVTLNTNRTKTILKSGRMMTFFIPINHFIKRLMLLFLQRVVSIFYILPCIMIAECGSYFRRRISFT